SEVRLPRYEGPNRPRTPGQGRAPEVAIWLAPPPGGCEGRQGGRVFSAVCQPEAVRLARRSPAPYHKLTSSRTWTPIAESAVMGSPASDSIPQQPTRISGPVAAGIAILAGVLRFLPYHWWNFTPIGALSLYGGARLRFWQACALPIAVMVVTDS